MSEPIQIVPEKIHIKSIKILGGSITSDSEAPPINKISSFDVQYGLKDELNFKAKTFRFIFSVSIEALDELNKTLGSKAQYSIEYIFSVDNIEYYITSVEKDSKTIVFHPVLPNTLMSIVYSTSRGIILSRTQGTIIDGVVLPVIDTRELLKSLEQNKDHQLETSNQSK